MQLRVEIDRPAREGRGERNRGVLGSRHKDRLPQGDEIVGEIELVGERRNDRVVDRRRRGRSRKLIGANIIDPARLRQRTGRREAEIVSPRIRERSARVERRGNDESGVVVDAIVRARFGELAPEIRRRRRVVRGDDRAVDGKRRVGRAIDSPAVARRLVSGYRRMS